MRFGQSTTFIRVDQMMTLMLIYGAGFAAIFLLFAAMYWRAARRVTDPVSRHEARVLIGHSFVYVGVAALSMALARVRRQLRERLLGHGLRADRSVPGPLPRPDGALLEAAGSGGRDRVGRRRAAGAQLRKPGKRVALIA